jgi:D-glycerate 3-kinase
MSLLTRWPREHLCLSEVERQHAVQAVERAFAPTVKSLQVDIGLQDLFEEIYVPLAAWLVARQRGLDKPLVIGINGAQGAGKSTLFNLLEVILEEGFGLRVIGFSIDDLYKTRAERERLAQEVHPLMETRGVPGTHDVELGIELLDSLINAGSDTLTKIPVFDKSIDDRCPPTVWQEWVGPVDVIVFEGWCVGALPQSSEALSTPVNSLEAEEDPSGVWRRYVNQQLNGPYQSLFSRLDLLLMLKVPSMQAVYEWRALQEQKLVERVKYIYDTQQPTAHLRIMNPDEIKRFIAHYERLTRAMLEELPGRADVCLYLNENHKIRQINVNTGGCSMVLDRQQG